MDYVGISKEAVTGVNLMKITDLPEDITDYFRLNVAVALEDNPDINVTKGAFLFMIEAGDEMKKLLPHKDA